MSSFTFLDDSSTTSSSMLFLHILTGYRVGD